jgi:hypothetical protein
MEERNWSLLRPGLSVIYHGTVYTITEIQPAADGATCPYVRIAPSSQPDVDPAKADLWIDASDPRLLFAAWQ